MSCWQDISTAPKDGTRILVLWGRLVEIALWNVDVDNWQQWPDGDFDIGNELTCWQPLPSPPNA
jgi:hypothetical protein